MQKKLPHSYRLLHCSDIHFHVIPTNPLMYFNKRFKGVLRLICGLANFQAETIAQRLPALIQQLQVDSICITGDFSLTALREEFMLAQTFIHRLQQLADVFILPGNHDVYTKQALKEQTYYQYFPNKYLQKEQIAFQQLPNHWWLVLLDCSCANGWCSANGEVTSEQMTKLRLFLDKLGPEEKIIIANHYPLLPTQRPSHDLLNNTILYETIKLYPSIQIYLHGHDHHAVVNTNNNLLSTCIVNSGSISLPSNARFHIIDLLPDSYKIHTLALTNLCKADGPLRYIVERSIQKENQTSA